MHLVAEMIFIFLIVYLTGSSSLFLSAFRCFLSSFVFITSFLRFIYLMFLSYHIISPLVKICIICTFSAQTVSVL